jgi:hypothetical protein
MDRRDLVMRCFGVVPGQVFAPFLGDNGCFVIRPGDSPDRINRILEQDRDALDLSSGRSPEQVTTPVTFCLADARQKFRIQHGLIGVGVLGLGASVPDSCDHETSCERSWDPPECAHVLLKIVCGMHAPRVCKP